MLFDFQKVADSKQSEFAYTCVYANRTEGRDAAYSQDIHEQSESGGSAAEGIPVLNL
jgi:hypothetical protein